jgi:2-keto-4-pentenoate hydratase/2-oxohepta-3-ene-1,7-dioic acid hydratase in catechol pathway
VLYVKPRNTLVGHGATVAVPAGVPALEVGAALGIGDRPHRLPAWPRPTRWPTCGRLVVADLCVPHDSFYRPRGAPRRATASARSGPQVWPAAPWCHPDALAVTCASTASRRARADTGDRIRAAWRALLADVSAFMTLQPGDVLMLGVSPARRGARPGQAVAVDHRRGGHAAQHAGGGGRHEDRPRGLQRRHPQRHAACDDTGLQLADGRVLAEDHVVWLPPFEVGTIIALGLNYADHVKELAKELTSHGAGRAAGVPEGPGLADRPPRPTRGPADAGLHALRMRAGGGHRPPARRVKRGRRAGPRGRLHRGNDYAVRDYLENWYRPNLRVKNRDGGTVLGPWLVSADDVPDPQALACAPGSTAASRSRAHGEHDPHRPGADRVPQQLHDPAARRHHPHRHARRRGQRQRRRRGRVRDRRHRPCQHIVGDAAFGR